MTCSPLGGGFPSRRLAPHPGLQLSGPCVEARLLEPVIYMEGGKNAANPNATVPKLQTTVHSDVRPGGELELVDNPHWLPAASRRHHRTAIVRFLASWSQVSPSGG